MQVRATAEGATGQVVGRSAFVTIQGRQAGHFPWPNGRQVPAGTNRSSLDLPDDLAHLLVSPPERRLTRAVAVWDLAYYVALEDARASGLLGLADGDGSTARIEETAIEWSGPHGLGLADRLLALAQAWLEKGRPGAAEYISTFSPRALSAEPTNLDDGTTWHIDRIDFRQRVWLPARR